ncbi:hypothetical protein L7F22_018585 [Adiantum nelumboides]|nr:hypothetical protein [Adiantum nelumboides]
MARQPTTAIINAPRSCRPALAAAVPLLSSCIFTSTTRGFAMARLRIAGGLSLGPLDCSSRDDPEMNSGFVNNDAFFVKECDSRTHCIHGGEFVQLFLRYKEAKQQALSEYYATGKDSQPAGYMDYLGALPVLETSNATSSVGCDAVFSTKSVPSQLTLFYAGTMNVFDNVTADKAKLIMSVAGGNDLSLQAMDTNGLIGRLLEGSDTALMEPLLTRSVQVQNAVKNKQAKESEVPSAAANSGRLQLPDEGQGHELPGYLVPCQAIVPKALPLARKVSLAQFLERRKDRTGLRNMKIRSRHQRAKVQLEACAGHYAISAVIAKLIMSVAGGNDLSLQAMDTNGLIGRLLEGSDTALMEPLLTRSVQVQNAVKNKQAKAYEVPSAAANSGRLQLPDEGQGHELPGYLVPCQAIVPKGAAAYSFCLEVVRFALGCNLINLLFFQPCHLQERYR